MVFRQRFFRALRRTVLVSAPFVIPAHPELLIEASANGRYLQTSEGVPWDALGDTGWSAIANLSDAEQDTYLEDRASRGFNFVVVNVLEHFFSADPPNDSEGNAPFTGTAFQSSENEAYFARVDRFILKAAALGIVCLLSVAYLGYGAGSEGWASEIAAASTTQMESYGDFLGNRYVNHDNIIWCLWGDHWSSTYETRYQALADGLLAADSRHLVTAHYAPNVSSFEHNYSYISLIWLYNYEDFGGSDNYAQEEAEAGYSAGTGKPCLSLEQHYERSSGTNANRIRRQYHQARLAGSISGHCFGDEGVWGFDNGIEPLSPWTNYLNDTGQQHILQGAAFYRAHPWWTLEPQNSGDSSSFITSGRGTFTDINWCGAAQSADGTLAVAYRNDFSSSITVNMAGFSGTVTVTWVDPTNGNTVAAGTFSNTGTQVFSRATANAAGNADWKLLFQAVLSSAPLLRRSAARNNTLIRM